MTFQFTGTDAMNSVLNRIAVDGQCQRQSFSPYGGNSTALAHTPGFNGERRDPLTGTTHLGNGYRAYNPTLMRFHCPDNMSPFGAGGINPYAYCAGDPINNCDPSGHMSAQAGAGIGLGVLGLALGAASFGVSIAAKVAVVASVAAIATGVASIATENSNPEASAALGWASLGLGIAAGVTQLASKAGSAISNSAPSRKMYTMLNEGMSGRGAGNAAKRTLTRTRNVTQGVPPTNMMDLPDEMLRHVASFLPRDQSVGHFNQVNRRLRDVTMDMRLTPTEHVMERTRNIPYVMSERQDRYFGSLAPERKNAVRLRYQTDVSSLNPPGPSFSIDSRTQLSSISSSYYEGLAENIIEADDIMESDIHFSYQQYLF